MSHRRAVAALLTLLLPAAALAGEARVEDFLPANAMVSLCYYGDNPDLAKTAMAQLAAEPEVADWLASVQQALAGATQFAAAFLRVDLGRLRPLLACQVGVAVLPPPMADGRPAGPPQVLAAAKVGAAGAAARLGAEGFLGQIGGLMGQGAGRKLQVGGIEVTQFGAGPFGLFYGFRGDFLVFATSADAMARALSADVAKVASLPAFQGASRMSGSPVAILLYNHEDVMELFGPEMGPPERAILASVGLNGVQRVGLRVGARDRALVGNVFIRTVGERQGLLRALASTPVDRSLLKLAPRDAAIACVMSIDPAEAYDAVLGVVHASGAAMGGEDLRGALAAFEQEAGVSLSRDVFGAMGRGTVVTTSGRSLLPALIVSQSLKDGDRLEAALPKLVARLDGFIRAVGGIDKGAALRTIQFGNHTIRYLATPGVPVPVAPCFARAGGRIVFALTPIHLKDYLAFLDAGEPSILDHPGFKELEPLIPRNATSISYSNSGEDFLALYSALGPFLTTLQGIPGNPVPFDLANLPSQRTVRKHMFGSVSYTYVADNLLVYENQSPFGVGFLAPAPALFLPAMFFAVATPRVQMARAEAAPVLTTVRNLRVLFQGLRMYLNNHEEDLPPSLDTIIAEGLIQGPGTLVAPEDPAPPKLKNGMPCSYVYLLDLYPGLKIGYAQLVEDIPSTQVPVFWERLAFARGLRNVCFADGHVEAVAEERFGQVLARIKVGLDAKAKAGKAGHL